MHVLSVVAVSQSVCFTAPTHVPQAGVVLLDTEVSLLHNSLSLSVHVQCFSALYVCIVNYMIRVTTIEEYMYSMYGMVVVCSRLHVHVQCAGKMATLEPVMCGVHLLCKSRSDRDIVVACIQAVIPLWLLIVVGMFGEVPV